MAAVLSGAVARRHALSTHEPGNRCELTATGNGVLAGQRAEPRIIPNALNCGYSLALVRGLPPEEVLRVMGAEPQGTCGGRFMEAFSAGSRAVEHSSNGGKPLDGFSWYEDGELRTTFDGPTFRCGSTPDALLPMMREVNSTA